MRSLRTRLLTSAALLLVVTFTVAAIALYWLMRNALLSEFDDSLRLEAQSLESSCEQDGDRVHLEPVVQSLPEYTRAEYPHFFQVWNQDGQVIAKSPSLGDQQLERPSGAFDSRNSLLIINGIRMRAITRSFVPRAEHEEHESASPASAGLMLVLARPTIQLDSTLSALAWSLFLVMGGAILGGCVVLRSLIIRELGPLNALANSIEQIGSTSSSDRIRFDDAPRELQPVVGRLNDLLDRQESAIAREIAFTADVAHELRTPLAGLKTTLEVCARQRRDPDDYVEAVAKCLRITRGMHSMVNCLLFLARADAQQLTIKPESTKLLDLLQDCWAPFGERAQHRGLVAQWSVSKELVALLDPEKIRVVFSNLFENAVTHAGDGGWIQIAAAASQAGTVVTIANNGCQLRPVDLPHIFDRFWRGDEARSQTGDHCGLGLSLCRKIMSLLGGQLTADIDEDVFSIQAQFPCAPVAKIPAI